MLQCINRVKEGMNLQESGLFYPNKMARIHVTSIEETIGHEAIMAVFEQAGIPKTLYPPANDFAKGFDFAYYGAIGIILAEMYGLRGERGLMLHAGRAAFDDGLAHYGSVLGISDLAFKALPTTAKLRVGIKAVAEAFNKFSDQLTTVAEEEDKFIYTINRCPACWGRTSDRPICFTTVGLLEEAFKWVSGGQLFAITEVLCHAVGYNACVFHVVKEPVK
jgi:predicted hydrocarbon binding protein